MNHFVEDYFWERGSPRGLRRLPPGKETLAPRSYRIVSDPYRKRTVVEKYCDGVFERLVYDSALFNFREWKTMVDGTWQRERIGSYPHEEWFLLRDPCDRTLLKERVRYVDGETCGGEIFSIHGILLSRHRLYRTAEGDSWDGVVLWDSDHHPIFRKEYEVDPATGAFTTLLKEEWAPRLDNFSLTG